MSDLARQEKNAIAQPSETEWASMEKQAKLLSESGIVPSALRKKPDDILVVLLAGRELGFTPMSSFSKIDVINGTPALRANAMVSLVFKAGHEFWIDPEADDKSATAYGRRKGSKVTHSFTFTIEDAATAGLLKKENGVIKKENWRLYPKAMLRARATSGLCKFLFADVLAGFTTTSEELGEVPTEELPAGRTSTADAQAEIEEGEVVEDDDWPPKWLWELQVHHPDEEILGTAREIVARNGGTRPIKTLEDLGDMPMHLRVELSRAITGGDANQEATEGGGNDVDVGGGSDRSVARPQVSRPEGARATPGGRPPAEPGKDGDPSPVSLLAGCKQHPDEAKPDECEACAGIVHGWGSPSAKENA